jgi:hypothetical protein
MAGKSGSKMSDYDTREQEDSEARKFGEEMGRDAAFKGRPASKGLGIGTRGSISPRSLKLFKKVYAESYARTKAAMASAGGAGRVNPKKRKPAGRTKARAAKKQKKATKKKNPLAAAAKLSEKFHGRPAKEVETIRETIHYHKNLTKLGDLVRIVIDTPTGLMATLTFNTSDDKRIVRLCSSEDGKQLYFRGGDQEINLKPLGMDGPRWTRDKIELGRLHEFPDDVDEGSIVYRAKKAFNNFRTTDWWHKAGEETSRKVGPGARPVLVYDFRNKLLELIGGNYAVRAPGIIN